MNKILLIIKREYLSRVKKKSFILMTILGPILMVGIMIVPIWLSMQKTEKQKVQVIDESFLFTDLIPEKDIVHFDYPPVTIEQARSGFFDTDYDAILWIPMSFLIGYDKAAIRIQTHAVGRAKAVGNDLSPAAIGRDFQQCPMMRHNRLECMPCRLGVVEISSLVAL